MKLFLKFHEHFVFSWMEYFRIHGLQDMVQQAGQRDQRLNLTALFPTVLPESSQVFSSSAPSSTDPKWRIATASRTVSQEVLNNVWTNFEIRLHAVIWASGGPYRTSLAFNQARSSWLLVRYKVGSHTSFGSMWFKNSNVTYIFRSTCIPRMVENDK